MTVGLSADGGETFNSSIEIPYSIIHDTPNLSVYATKASLAEVATSGSYADLSNKPIIPSVYNLPARVALAMHTVPIERSIPPVAITNVTPRPMIA